MSSFVVYLSQIKDADAFETAVQMHIAAMIKHQIDKSGRPRPTADSLVECCVKRVVQGSKKPDTFISDYVVEDDTPHDQISPPEGA